MGLNKTIYVEGFFIKLDLASCLFFFFLPSDDFGRFCIEGSIEEYIPVEQDYSIYQTV